MSLLKKFISRIKGLRKKEAEDIHPGETKRLKLNKVTLIDEFWQEYNRVKREAPPDKIPEYLQELLSKIDVDLKKQIHRIIRARLYGIDIEENEDKEFVKSFINFRVSLYNPQFKNSGDTRLGKLILTIISRFPDALKNKKISDSHTAIFNKDDLEIKKLSNELLNMYKLTQSEVEQTIQKIIEYNRKNVKFTEEEQTVITNSELLRNFLESITFLLQDFVEKCNNWKKYFLKTFLFDDPALLKVLNFDKKLFFGEEFQKDDFADLVFTKNIKKELEPYIREELRALFQKDVSAVISRMKKQIIKEEKEFIREIRTTISGYIVLLNQNNELPSFKVLNSLLSKSFKFHENYYPDLINIVKIIKREILETLGKDYSNYNLFIDKYSEELEEFIYRYSKDNFKITVDYGKFVEILEEKPEKIREYSTPAITREFLPEELKFISSNLDVEPAIMELNEKIKKAEISIPLFEGEYFFTNRKEYIKTAILEALNTLLSTREKGELIKSVLLKTIDTSQGDSSKIALELLSSMKPEAIQLEIVKKLLKKQKAKNHITETIKKLLIKEDEFFYNNQENLKIDLQKFSKVTGIGFFIATVNENENYKVTAHFKDGAWKITYFNKIGEFGF